MPLGLLTSWPKSKPPYCRAEELGGCFFAVTLEMNEHLGLAGPTPYAFAVPPGTSVELVVSDGGPIVGSWA